VVALRGCTVIPPLLRQTRAGTGACPYTIKTIDDDGCFVGGFEMVVNSSILIAWLITVFHPKRFEPFAHPRFARMNIPDIAASGL
jgi:hypothetical protein